MKFENVYFINGTAYAGKSTMIKAWQKGVCRYEHPNRSIMENEENPDKAFDNFKECLKRINSKKL